jgi:adenosylmethionine-8-amino-7-oxononanoate aminotransferase
MYCLCLFPTIYRRFKARSNNSFRLRLKQIAAFIYEPLVQGAGGMKIYDATLFDMSCYIQLQRKEILLIADEVMTGFGRTGKLICF